MLFSGFQPIWRKGLTAQERPALARYFGNLVFQPAQVSGHWGQGWHECVPFSWCITSTASHLTFHICVFQSKSGTSTGVCRWCSSVTKPAWPVFVFTRSVRTSCRRVLTTLCACGVWKPAIKSTCKCQLSTNPRPPCDFIVLIDEILGRCPTSHPVTYLGAHINHPSFFSVSQTHADIWKVENVHTFHTRIGYVYLQLYSIIPKDLRVHVNM